MLKLLRWLKKNNMWFELLDINFKMVYYQIGNPIHCCLLGELWLVRTALTDWARARDRARTARTPTPSRVVDIRWPLYPILSSFPVRGQPWINSKLDFLFLGILQIYFIFSYTLNMSSIRITLTVLLIGVTFPEYLLIIQHK